MMMQRFVWRRRIPVCARFTSEFRDRPKVFLRRNCRWMTAATEASSAVHVAGSNFPSPLPPPLSQNPERLDLPFSRPTASLAYFFTLCRDLISKGSAGAEAKSPTEAGRAWRSMFVSTARTAFSGEASCASSADQVLLALHELRVKRPDLKEALALEELFLDGVEAALRHVETETREALSAGIDLNQQILKESVFEASALTALRLRSWLASDSACQDESPLGGPDEGLVQRRRAGREKVEALLSQLLPFLTGPLLRKCLAEVAEDKALVALLRAEVLRRLEGILSESTSTVEANYLHETCQLVSQFFDSLAHCTMPPPSSSVSLAVSAVEKCISLNLKETSPAADWLASVASLSRAVLSLTQLLRSKEAPLTDEAFCALKALLPPLQQTLCSWLELAAEAGGDSPCSPALRPIEEARGCGILKHMLIASTADQLREVANSVAALEDELCRDSPTTAGEAVSDPAGPDSQLGDSVRSALGAAVGTLLARVSLNEEGKTAKGDTAASQPLTGRQTGAASLAASFIQNLQLALWKKWREVVKSAETELKARKASIPKPPPNSPFFFAVSPEKERSASESEEAALAYNNSENAIWRLFESTWLLLPKQRSELQDAFLFRLARDVVPDCTAKQHLILLLQAGIAAERGSPSLAMGLYVDVLLSHLRPKFEVKNCRDVSATLNELLMLCGVVSMPSVASSLKLRDSGMAFSEWLPYTLRQCLVAEEARPETAEARRANSELAIECLPPVVSVLIAVRLLCYLSASKALVSLLLRKRILQIAKQ